MRQLFLIVSLCLAQLLVAQGLTPHSRITLDKMHHSDAHRSKAMGDVPAFITMDDGMDIDQLQSLGVRVTAHFGNLVTAMVPLQHIGSVAAHRGVARMSIAQSLELCNDSARYAANVDDVLDGINLPQQYRGKGVLVGVIDSGIDFNHINFKDSLGNSRVVAVYLPEDSTGVAPVVDGLTLPGSVYDDEQAIAALTTDTPTMTHGTHTTGTAAGGYLDIPYYGIASDADIVLCGLTVLEDVYIADALRYMSDLATRRGQPLVVNMSFGGHDGAHDGTSPLCAVYNEIADRGHILVVSASNNGHQKMHLNHHFAARDTVTTSIASISGSKTLNGYLSTWSRDNTRHAVSLFIIDGATGQVAYETPFSDTLVPDSVWSVKSESDSTLALYVTGEISIAAALDETNGKYNSVIVFDVTKTSNDHILGIRYTSPQACDIDSWVANTFQFTRSGHKDYLTGSTVGSINDLATTDAVISVGSMCSRMTVPTYTGSASWLSRATIGDIAYYSSYGPDINGTARPDVVAPGHALVSSGNRYYFLPPDGEPRYGNIAALATVDGVEYPYSTSTGTSMATPMVTGTIALWLQECPNLSPADIRQLLYETCIRDTFVTEGEAARWGAGKLDASATMRALLEAGAGDVNHDGSVDAFDVNVVIQAILGEIPYSPTADINHDGIIDAIDLNRLVDYILYPQSRQQVP